LIERRSIASKRETTQRKENLEFANLILNEWMIYLMKTTHPRPSLLNLCAEDGTHRAQTKAYE
jgi:hypothetical protein